MPTTIRPRAVGSVARDGAVGPGSYMTDGVRLLRVAGFCGARRGYVAIEDCASLELTLVSRRELRTWDLRPVHLHAASGAA